MTAERDSASEAVRARAGAKSATAFRTISEVSEELEVPQHVLRFWETKFSQVRPLKRGGGRRYYRPEDVALLRRIQRLLYSEGYTIKGVQRLLRDPRANVADGDDDETGTESAGAADTADADADIAPAGEADAGEAEGTGTPAAVMAPDGEAGPAGMDEDGVGGDDDAPADAGELRSLSRIAAAVARADSPPPVSGTDEDTAAASRGEDEAEDRVILPSPFLTRPAAEPPVLPGWVRQKLTDLRDELRQIHSDLHQLRK